MNYGKFANTYKNGKIISKKDKWGRTRNYTVEELEKLVDELAEDKDENGKVKDPVSLNNVNMILFQAYQKYGNPHEKEIIEAIKRAQETKTLEAQKQDALAEIDSVLGDNAGREEVHSAIRTGFADARGVQEGENNEEYTEFEEVKDEAA